MFKLDQVIASLIESLGGGDDGPLVGVHIEAVNLVLIIHNVDTVALVPPQIRVRAALVEAEVAHLIGEVAVINLIALGTAKAWLTTWAFDVVFGTGGDL